MFTSSAAMRIVALCACASLACVHTALAQDPQSERQREKTQRDNRANLQRAETDRETPSQTQTRGRRQAAGGVGDRQLVRWVLVDNQGEIALAQLAQQRSDNPEVKQFAQQLVQEHQQFVAKLQEAAGQEGTRRGARRTPQGAGQAEPPSSRTPGQDIRQQRRQQRRQQPQEQRQGRADQRQPAGATTSAGGAEAQTQAAGPAGAAWMQLREQIAQRKLQATQQELTSHQGSDFDQAFLGQQLLGHIEMLATLNVLQQQASPELQRVFADGASATQGHLEEIRSLMQKLDGGQSPRTQRRTGTPQND